MTFYRQRPLKQFRCYLVQPVGEFSPKNWREKPKRFKILESRGGTIFPGKADAFRFCHNHAAIESGKTTRWAIYLTD